MFSAAGAGVKNNLLFFTQGKPTEKIWYYDLSDVKVGKKAPLTLSHFEDFAAKLATREDLKAVNPNRRTEVDRRTPAELLDLIDAKGREVAAV